MDDKEGKEGVVDEEADDEEKDDDEERIEEERELKKDAGVGVGSEGSGGDGMSSAADVEPGKKVGDTEDCPLLSNVDNEAGAADGGGFAGVDEEDNSSEGNEDEEGTD